MSRYKQASVEIEESLRFLTAYQAMLDEAQLQTLRRIINNAAHKEEMGNMRRYLEKGNGDA
jgi:hypothetical protein